MWYKNHIEAVYVIEGDGELEGISNRKTHHLYLDTVYTFNSHEFHIVRPKTDVRMVCQSNLDGLINKWVRRNLAHPFVSCDRRSCIKCTAWSDQGSTGSGCSGVTTLRLPPSTATPTVPFSAIRQTPSLDCSVYLPDSPVPV